VTVAAYFVSGWYWIFTTVGAYNHVSMRDGTINLLHTKGHGEYVLRFPVNYTGPIWRNPYTSTPNWNHHAAWANNSTTLAVSVPLWWVAAPLLLLTAILWWLDRRRVPPGHCRKCGYDLTGNVTGVCPECGAPASVRRPAPPPGSAAK